MLLLYNEENQCRIGVPTYKKTYLLISIAYTRVSFSWTTTYITFMY